MKERKGTNEGDWRKFCGKEKVRDSLEVEREKGLLMRSQER